MTRSENTQRWRKELRAFAHRLRSTPLPDGHMLNPLGDWQRKITGGSLLKFLEHITEPDFLSQHPRLDSKAFRDRVFLFITDVPGSTAAHSILDSTHPQALWLLQSEWKAWLEDPAKDHDDSYLYHYECWSVWHQNLNPQWQLKAPTDANTLHKLWVHEEGWVVTEGIGRGAQHIWRWDENQMVLLEQDITSWSSP